MSTFELPKKCDLGDLIVLRIHSTGVRKDVLAKCSSEKGVYSIVSGVSNRDIPVINVKAYTIGNFLIVAFIGTRSIWVNDKFCRSGKKINPGTNMEFFYSQTQRKNKLTGQTDVRVEFNVFADGKLCS